MNQLTLRGLDDALEQELKKLAQEKNISLNKAALLLMREGAGLNNEHKANTVANSLDHLIASWTEEEEKEFLKTQTAFEVIDADLWQ